MRKFFSSVLVVLSLSVSTMFFTSCERVLDELEQAITGYENCGGGPWTQRNGVTIYSLGGGWYKVVDNVSGKEIRRQLKSLRSLEHNAPYSATKISRYYPYYDTFTEVLGWWVECNNGDYWVNPNTGGWIRQ